MPAATIHPEDEPESPVSPSALRKKLNPAAQPGADDAPLARTHRCAWRQDDPLGTERYMPLDSPCAFHAGLSSLDAGATPKAGAASYPSGSSLRKAPTKKLGWWECFAAQPKGEAFATIEKRLGVDPTSDAVVYLVKRFESPGSEKSTTCVARSLWKEKNKDEAHNAEKTLLDEVAILFALGSHQLVAGAHSAAVDGLPRKAGAKARPWPEGIASPTAFFDYVPDAKALDEVMHASKRDFAGELYASNSEVRLACVTIELYLALQYVHSRGVIHQDIKPSNILVTLPAADGPLIKLTGFGCARFASKKAECPWQASQTGKPAPVKDGWGYPDLLTAPFGGGTPRYFSRQQADLAVQIEAAASEREYFDTLEKWPVSLATSDMYASALTVLEMYGKGGEATPHASWSASPDAIGDAAIEAALARIGAPDGWDSADAVKTKGAVEPAPEGVRTLLRASLAPAVKLRPKDTKVALGLLGKDPKSPYNKWWASIVPKVPKVVAAAKPKAITDAELAETYRGLSTALGEYGDPDGAVGAAAEYLGLAATPESRDRALDIYCESLKASGPPLEANPEGAFAGSELRLSRACHMHWREKMLGAADSFPRIWSSIVDVGHVAKLVTLDLCGPHDLRDPVLEIAFGTGALGQGLPKLKTLDLSGCSRVSGSVPKEIGRCTALETLRLRECSSLGGTIPKEIGECKFLRVAEFAECRNIKGGIPITIGDCKAIEVIDFAGCTGLTSPLPQQTLGKCRNLKVLNLHMCSGIPKEIPDDVGGCVALETLELSGCSGLEGEIPQALANCPHLTTLKLAGCWSLQGALPERLGECKQLKHLDLRRCSGLQGGGRTIPQALLDRGMKENGMLGEPDWKIEE